VKRRLFLVLWHSVNVSLFVSLLLFAYGSVWEYSTRRYLRGFADAVVPLGAAPEQKAESILAWMGHGPGRNTSTQDAEWFAQRDPEETLNYEQLLRVCGSATNAFVNLASSSGLPARRLLLLDSDFGAKHVVAEILLNNRWVVADPAYRVLLRDDQGRLLTKEQLRSPVTFQQATETIPNYPSSYTYEKTSILRLRRIPLLGSWLRPVLNTVYPDWEKDFDWTLLVERESFAFLVISGLLFGIFTALHLLLAWYCDQHLGLPRHRFRERVRRAGAALLADPS
jgi:hypothetical protein